MKIPKNSKKVEKQARLDIGTKLLKEAGLPISVQGEVSYSGKLDISEYRKYFSQDDINSVYLTLLKDFPNSPIVAEAIVTLYQLNHMKERAKERQDFEKAIELEDKIKSLAGTLVNNSLK